MRLALRVAPRFCLPSDFNSAADAMARLLHHGELEEDHHTRAGFLGAHRDPESIVQGPRESEITHHSVEHLPSPEIADVGLYEKDVKEKGIEADTFTQELNKVDH